MPGAVAAARIRSSLNRSIISDSCGKRDTSAALGMTAQLNRVGSPNIQPLFLPCAMPSPAPFRPLRALLLPLLLLGSCQSGSKSKPETAAAVASPAAPDSAAFITRHPEWARHATIYQVNVRQYTPQRTFRAAEADLPRLQKMGVGILWLMPINPIGLSHRKGTLADLQHYVGTAHRRAPATPNPPAGASPFSPTPTGCRWSLTRCRDPNRRLCAVRPASGGNRRHCRRVAKHSPASPAPCPTTRLPPASP